ncbi:MAG: endonuclease domain-containing protein [Acidaminococcus sp.]|jgi:hypothetical protein|nr:endonuclease domain-containing protein [Acidaminococcus sp.]MCI2116441.1 endonuclease domain-containing protein [Acidaminococcus sp.]
MAEDFFLFPCASNFGSFTPSTAHFYFVFLYSSRICNIVDFCCAKAKLIVEVDGIQHIEEEIEEYDAKRTVFLKNRGYEVIRFSNS